MNRQTCREDVFLVTEESYQVIQDLVTDYADHVE